jgi:poly-gamma-glutamate capsule biosynthesis protein CapA/YwtB (metallophosphatase superfamily)
MRKRRSVVVAAEIVGGLLLVLSLVSSQRLANLALAQEEEQGAAAGRTVRANALPPERNLVMKITSPFTFAGVGDIILRHPVAQLADPSFQGLIQNLRDADVAFANMEGTIIDYDNLPTEGIRGGMPKSGIADLKAMGIKIMNHANNHTMDSGTSGMIATNTMLLDAGIAQAGTGKNLQEARSPAYISTPKGRIALVGMFSQDPTSGPAPASTDGATYKEGDEGGVPGLNALRVTQTNIVTEDQLEALRKIRDSVYARRNEPAYAYPMATIPANEPKDRLELFGQAYKAGPKPGELSWTMNPQDLHEILRSIRDGKEYADFMVVTIHCHQNSHAYQQYSFDSDVPDFLVELAHKAIDNGADVFIGHGVHTLRGVEIYKGKPIFYGVSNFINELAQSSVPQNPGGDLTQAESANMSADGSPFTTSNNLEALLTTSRYDGGHLVEVRLYPADLGRDKKRPLSRQGIPMTPSPEVARQILEKVQTISKPFGTTISIENNVGVIHVAQTETHLGQF